MECYKGAEDSSEYNDDGEVQRDVGYWVARAGLSQSAALLQLPPPSVPTHLLIFPSPPCPFPPFPVPPLFPLSPSPPRRAGPLKTGGLESAVTCKLPQRHLAGPQSGASIPIYRWRQMRHGQFWGE